MKEAPVEERFRKGLEGFGFKVLKLVTPGNTGTPDRMILRPTWSPGPPWVVEIKRPGKTERRLQEVIHDNWTVRGVLVLPMIDNYAKCDVAIIHLVRICAYSDFCSNYAKTTALDMLDVKYP